jgi:hypothetical protein
LVQATNGSDQIVTPQPRKGIFIRVQYKVIKIKQMQRKFKKPGQVVRHKRPQVIRKTTWVSACQERPIKSL